MKEHLDKYLDAINNDYVEYYKTSDVTEEFKNAQLKAFREELRYTEGKNYFKIISGTGVHSFIVKEDGKKFKRGDVLKAAGWAGPAKNKARGNIFTTYHINWTGPDYLRG